MAGTRSSVRHAEHDNSSPAPLATTGGIKRKADDLTRARDGGAGNQRPAKGQKTLEESMPLAEKEGQEDEGFDEPSSGAPTDGSDDECVAEENANLEDRDSALEQVRVETREDGSASNTGKTEGASNGAAKGAAVEVDQEREKAQPSNILEKGIIYFFTRGRVGVDDPSSVTDLQRSFFVLKPLPDGAKLTNGTMLDVGNNRLIALPKKVWPKSGKDKFMVFVEKSKTSMEDLKENFFQGSSYSTKTTGTRHTPDIEMIGEGVYAMTSTGQGRTTTHLAYVLTIPKEIGEVQTDVGLAERGSFVLSVKNPEASAPSNAQLPATAEYPKDIIDEFRGRGWLAAAPKHLDYDNASMLLIGESFDGGALEPAPNDEKRDDKEVPKEELEKLEEEDEQRVDNLNGDDTIFDDLGVSSKVYGLKSTW